jgi:peroxiredoxin
MKARFQVVTVLFALALVLGCSSRADDEAASGAGAKATDKPAQAGADTAPAAPKTATVGERAPDFTLSDSNGATHSLADYRGKFVVLEWVSPDCPFVRAHYDAGNMQQLQATYTAKGVVWLSICSSAPGKQGYYEGDALRGRIAAMHSKATAYLVDSDGKVGTTYGARTTPDMFVINPDGVLIYAGGIDDKPRSDKDEILNAPNYVRMALNAAMAGKEVEIKTARSYGCSVKYQ